MYKTESPTILWHDYETWGVSPQKDLPCQFAAIRTDMELNEIGKPINIMSKIASDYLPHPQACLVTGLTPQHTFRDGEIEADFARKIYSEMSQPNTCVVGYNSIRFDDEVSRYLFYRNFYDPYAREWKNGNSRWDIIDLARACYALRPDGINWPHHDDGSVSFKLESLTKANDLEHGQAHDALSDVRATIALAKLIKTKQPKLYDYAFSLRKKHNVLAQINLEKLTPIIHVSSRFSASKGCVSWVLPIAKHPTNNNAIITIDLSKNPSAIIDQDAASIKEKLYMPSSELSLGEERPGIKLIHVNRSPFIASAKSMTEENALRLGIDREECLAHYKALCAHDSLIQKVIDVFEDIPEHVEQDVDHALYSGGFYSDEEKRWCNKVITTPPLHLEKLTQETQNSKLQTMLFRYRARNYPQTLSEAELIKWQAHRQSRLQDHNVHGGLNIEEFIFQLEQLASLNENSPNKLAILRALFEYVKKL